jgi:hypothetical protein
MELPLLSNSVEKRNQLKKWSLKSKWWCMFIDFLRFESISVSSIKGKRREWVWVWYPFRELPPHPNVVQMFGISIDGPQPIIVMEYCAGGNQHQLGQTLVFVRFDSIWFDSIWLLFIILQEVWMFCFMIVESDWQMRTKFDWFKELQEEYFIFTRTTLFIVILLHETFYSLQSAILKSL